MNERNRLLKAFLVTMLIIMVISYHYALGINAPWSMYGFLPEHTFSSPEQISIPMKLLWEYESGGGFATKTGPAYHKGNFIVPLVSGRLISIDESGKTVWSKKLSKYPLISHPVPIGDYVVQTTSTGQVFAILVKTGEIKWTFDAKTPIASSVVVMGGLVFVFTSNGLVIKLTLNGLYPFGSLELGSSIKTDPIVLGNRIFIAGSDKVFSISKNLKLNWIVSIDGTIESGLVGAQNGVAVVSGVGVLKFLSIDDGTTFWSLPIGNSCPAGLLADSNSVYAFSKQGNIFSVSSSKGSVNWTSFVDGFLLGHPVMFAGKIYIGTWSKRIACITQAAGEFVWSVRTKQGFLGGLAACNSGVLALPDVGKGFCFSLSKGMLNWSINIGGLSYSAPVCDTDRVYLTLTDGSLRAINQSNGQDVWKTDFGGQILASPAISGNKIIVASKDQPITCVDKTNGSNIWRSSIDDYMNSPPVVDGLFAYVGAWDGRIYCIDLKTGRRVWSQSTSDIITTSPSLTGDGVFVGSWDKRIYNLDRLTGAIRWVHSTPDNVESTISLDTNRAFYWSQDTVNCLLQSSGSELWQINLDGQISCDLAVTKTSVYAVTENGTVYSINQDNGQINWTKFANNKGQSSLIVFSGTLCLTSGSTITLLSTIDGSHLWSYDCGVVLTPPIVSGNKLYVSSLTGSLFCFTNTVQVQPQDIIYSQGPTPIGLKELIQKAHKNKTTPNEIPPW